MADLPQSCFSQNPLIVLAASIFGHPHKEVVERWRASGAEVMTTGQRGTITVVTDGKDLRVTTFVR